MRFVHGHVFVLVFMYVCSFGVLSSLSGEEFREEGDDMAGSRLQRLIWLDRRSVLNCGRRDWCEKVAARAEKFGV